MIAGTIFGLVIVALLIVTAWLIQSRQDIAEMERILDREMTEVDRLRGEALVDRQTIPCFECGEPMVPVLKCQKCGDTVIGDEGNAILDRRMARPTEF